MPSVDTEGGVKGAPGEATNTENPGGERVWDEEPRLKATRQPGVAHTSYLSTPEAEAGGSL